MPVSLIPLASAVSGALPKAQMPSGSVLQVVSTTKSNYFETSSASFTDITGFNVSITPTSATSKILVLMNTTIGCSTATAFVPVRLVRDSTAICIGDANGSRTRSTAGSNRVNDVSDCYSLGMNFLDSPATTSATTYKVQILTNAGFAKVNSNGAFADNAATGTYASTITVMEIAG
jgi:hypothetical protein